MPTQTSSSITSKAALESESLSADTTFCRYFHAQVEDEEPWEGELTLVLNELMEEAGLPRPGAADHEELEQEV